MSTIVLCGKSGSGKTTVGKELERLGYKKIVTYTTRPKRAGEVDGVDYHFVSEAEFQALADTGQFAETASYNASFGFCRYGSLKSDYGIPHSYIILNPIGLKAVKNQGPGAFTVYLYADKETLVKRLKARGDTEVEITRRLKADDEDFALFDSFADLLISADAEPAAIAKAIAQRS